MFSVLDNLTVQVEWDAPFTWEDFPITNYTLLVVIAYHNTSVQQTVIFNPSVFSYNLTRTQEPVCSNLTFSVSASNSVGSSSASMTQGSYPSGKSIPLCTHTVIAP